MTDPMRNVDEMLDRVAPGMGMRWRLMRWFGSRPGQHAKCSGVPNNRDLIRLHGGAQGLPTIREDLAPDCSKIRLATINGEGVDMLDHVLGRLSTSQREHLGRLA